FKVRFGRFDADFGLEEATSSKWITAIERSVIFDLVEWTQQEEENLGLELQATAMDVLYVSAGFFRQNSTEIIDGEERRVAEDDNGKGKNSYVLRAVLTPVRTDEQVVHLGAA